MMSISTGKEGTPLLSATRRFSSIVASCVRTALSTLVVRLTRRLARAPLNHPHAFADALKHVERLRQFVLRCGRR